MEGYELCLADCVESSQPVELFSIEQQKNRLVLANESLVEDTRQVLEESTGWLPLFAEMYNVSRHLKDYILVPVVIMPSDLPNRNAQAFPFQELIRADPETGLIGFETWARKCTHKDHCFPGDAPIVTNKGIKYIKDIKKGDMVLSHNRVFQKVISTFKNGNKKLKEIRAFGLPEPIKITNNHPLWIIDTRQIHENIDTTQYGFKVNRKRKFDIKWDELKPHFRPVSDVYNGDYVCIPINIGGDISVDKNFAFLTGIHMAEGCYEWYNNKPVAVQLTINIGEIKLKKKIEECLNNLNIKYNIYYHKIHNICLISIRDKEFAEKMYKYTGSIADKKEMKNELRNWNKESMKWFLGGYVSCDGCVSRYGRNTSKKLKTRSSSKQLSIDIWHSLAFVGVASSVNYDSKPKTYNYYCDKYKKFRTIKSKDSYCVSALDFEAFILNDYLINKPTMYRRNSHRTNQKIMLKENYMITPIYSIKYLDKKEEVFNIEVANDNSYIAYNIAVHNCNKDITKAKGIIFSSTMRPIHNCEGNLHKVLALLGYDRHRDPILANEILTGERPHFSMGAWAKYFTCSVCGGKHSSREDECEHIVARMPRMKRMNDGKLVYLQARYILGFEVSSVSRPAFASATTPTSMHL